MEQMLVTQALDERDLLEKKINQKIAAVKFIDYAKNNESRGYESRLERDAFVEETRANFQQIMDLIRRHQRIEAALLASNAASTIKTSFGVYTVAEAIALRNRLRNRDSLREMEDLGLYETDRRSVTGGFRKKLADAMQKQYTSALAAISVKNKALEAQAETMRLSILGKDAKVREEKPLAVVEAYVKENQMELLDPLDLKNMAQQMLENEEALLKELDTQIKISNATTLLTIQ